MQVRARGVVLLGVCLVLLVTCVGTSTAPDGSASPLPRQSASPGDGVTPRAAPSGAESTAVPRPRAVTRAPSPGSTVLADAPAEVTAVQVSQDWWEVAPVVVVAPADDVQAQLRGASVAVQLGSPLLLAGPGVVPGAPGSSLAAEVARLGTVQVLAVGAVDPAVLGADAHRPTVLALPTDPVALARLVGTPATVTPVAAGGETEAVAGLGVAPVLLGQVGPATAGTADPTAQAAPPVPPIPEPSIPEPSIPVLPGSVASPSGPSSAGPRVASILTFVCATPVRGAVQLTDGRPGQLAALATARAAGVGVVVVPGGDPRTSPAVVQALAAAHPVTVLGVGSAFGTGATFATRVAVASTGVQLPGGGQTITPGKRYVALYGTPGTASLGVLGEQDVPATVARAEAMAAPYRALTTDNVIPTVEIIATIASGGPGSDGNYSQERPVAELRPLVDAAHAAGMYVVLDLQPGRSDFLTQAQQYAELLSMPNVGLALDPEWRLAPDQVHLKQIGSVSIEEVNAVVTWLADLTRDRALPQKLLVLHEFASRMIVGIDRLDTSRDELALMVHVDGQGTQPAKAGTWGALRAAAPNVGLWGWKNFIDEDVPMLDPAQTYQVQPTPILVTYQ